MDSLEQKTKELEMDYLNVKNQLELAQFENNRLKEKFYEVDIKIIFQY